MNEECVIVSVSVDVNTPDITPPFPLIKYNVSNVQSVISVSPLLSDMRDALNSTDSKVGVVTWGVTVIVFRITLQSDDAVISVYPILDGHIKSIFVYVTCVPLHMNSESLMSEAESGLVTGLDKGGSIEIVPEENKVDSDSAVCVPSAS